MVQLPPELHTDPERISAIEGRIPLFHDEALLEVRMADGSLVRGYVAVRPTIQTFTDQHGREGMNAVVRIDDAAQPGVMHYLWLDRIVEVRHIGSA